MTVILHLGDCLDALPTLPAESVQCCVTSPPYWGLRDYGVSGQLGLEPTPEEYVAHMVAVFREVRRVLRDDGTLWLNLGDSYAGGHGGRGDAGNEIQRADGTMGKTTTKHDGTRIIRPLCGLKPKDLVGIPWRVAFALQADGWYLRSDIIWAKPNPMPESVTDRPTKAHEYLFLLAKSARYYYDHEAVKEPSTASTIERGRYGWNGVVVIDGDGKERRAQPDATDKMGDRWCAPSRNRRDVWTITTKPYKGAHFATMPPDLAEPCILAGTSERGCCPTCGAPWERVVEMGNPTKQTTRGKQSWAAVTGQRDNSGGLPMRASSTTGWQPTCACDAGDPMPCVVLDPFCGSGTVGEVATRLGRSFVGIDLNPDYRPMQEERIAKGERAWADVQAQPLLFQVEASA